MTFGSSFTLHPNIKIRRRKLNIQKMLDRTVVPTPSAARCSDPRLAINAVSTRPVRGSAIRENRTGTDRNKTVRCGCS